MTKFFCNGKKDFCDSRKCADCDFCDDSGGTYVDHKNNRAMKEKLKNAIAIVMTILIIYMEIMGFWFMYLLLAYSFNLPPDWWVGLVSCVLACASVWGVKEWLVRN